MIGFARSGTRPRWSKPCLAALSPSNTHRMLFCRILGMTSETMGMFGLYLLTSCAVCPVRVNTMIIDAPTLDAARTADDASASA